MRDTKIGRLVPASLHQAIADLVPTRLDFYEAWLRPEDLRRGSLAPGALAAVLGFLRQEAIGYDRLVSCAGRHASQWTLDLNPTRRRVRGWTPVVWLVRRAVAVARELTRASYAPARLEGRIGRRGGALTLRASPFCDVRSLRDAPLCGFYRAVVDELLTTLQVQAEVVIDSCRAMGDADCVLKVRVGGRLRTATPSAPEPGAVY